jgi:sulfatase maturation enzyme AslB (radical SAM superfamily)
LPDSHLTTMDPAKPKRDLDPRRLIAAWARILTGKVPLLSIEITRECPLSCPGCYAYGDAHLGGGVTLRELSDFRGDALVDGVVNLVRKHKPLHVSLVGGEPLVRHRELSKILPMLSEMGIFALVVTSGIIAIPQEWMALPRVRVAVSIDGLPEHHDIRRKPATYEKILTNLQGREVNIHWTITRQMLQRAGYLEEYVKFWNARPEVNRLWVSVYTPQTGEESAERLIDGDRKILARELPALAKRYPKLLFTEGLAEAMIHPPANPDDCVFAKLSANYSADLKSRVEPCVFGGNPDCSQCGCAISSGLHWVRTVKMAGPLKVDHFIGSSIKIGNFTNRVRNGAPKTPRWTAQPPRQNQHSDLVQIASDES